MNGVALGAQIVAKTLGEILPQKLDSPRARVLLLAIGMQESKFKERVQRKRGLAHSFWQEEPNGIKAVLSHSVVGPMLVSACSTLGVPANWGSIYREVVNNDVLACAVARLLLYADTSALPEIGDVDSAWDYYVRNWRPGKPRRSSWTENYRMAREQEDV